jgi:hypothetical protein
MGIVCNRMGTDRPHQHIVNCTVAGAHEDCGIVVGEGVDIQILNTISVGAAGPAVDFEDTYDQTVIDRSILQTSGPDATIVWGGNTQEPLEFDAEQINSGEFDAETGQQSTLLAGIDPGVLFKDYAAGDLQLQPGAPARDFATIQDAPEFDYLRRLRKPDGNFYDVGAYEFFARLCAADPAWIQYR